MSDSIDAHVEFSFKGETYSLVSTIALGSALDPHAEPSSFHAILAARNSIDTYSYLYEVMQQEDIRFDNAQGQAADFCTDGEFDFQAYVANKQASNVIVQLEQVASRELGIDDLEQHPELKNALLHAYELGRQATP
ncbi:MAG: hypothetical protein Q8O37_04165 [Sulfuricellaceae bacterium]|nr:hypothetical protein [Sulfuricellaceae bacterium]